MLKIVQLFWKKTQEFPTEIALSVLVFCVENRIIFLKKKQEFCTEIVLPVLVFCVENRIIFLKKKTGISH